MGNVKVLDRMHSGTDKANRHRWIVLAVGVAAQASFSMGFQGIPATGPLLQEAYRLTLDQLGLVLGAIALGIAASEVVWGLLTDKLGDRFVLLTGLLSTSLIFALLAMFGAPRADSIPGVMLLGAGLLALGIFGGSINGSSGKAVMTWFQDGERGFAMSIRQTAVPVGGGIGAAILPWVALHMGFISVFTTLAVTSLLAAGAAWTWLTPAPVQPAPKVSSNGPVSSTLRDWSIWRLFVASGLLTVPQFAVLTFSAIYLINEYKYGIAITSAVIFAVQVIGAIARVWSGCWTDKHKNRRTVVRAIAVLAAVALLLLQLNIMTINVPLLSVVLLIAAGVFGSAWHGVAYTEIAVMAGASRVGTALGIENTAVFAAAFATPALIPWLLRVCSWPQLWGGIAVLCLIAAALAPKSES
ncbi:sugar phosphate permease [Pseudomonas graminis]|uniref:MFS transporter n=1 Tax=Pseudomonas graminis TaxID=158627 RepID=UPI0010D9EB58|nr:MFS transporter [Pseudomonas graminis]TDV47288.1 sugar phosphate permease [Pseudomonas graminis]